MPSKCSISSKYVTGQIIMKNPYLQIKNNKNKHSHNQESQLSL